MINAGRALMLVIVTAALVAVSGAFYTVDESRQAVITQFGEPIGRPVTEAGLHFKLPFVQTANMFERRILRWDGDPNQIPTLDKRYIWVDITARWRIVDALRFMESVGSETEALGRLDYIIDGATRNTISNALLVEAVRNSNRLLEGGGAEGEGAIDELALDDAALERISTGRERLTDKILADSTKKVVVFGIELVDVRIKRINYVDKVQQRVFERMISERKRAAEKYRSEGQGKKAEIEGQMAKELKDIRSNAYREAQTITGKADAEAIRLYAESYNKDPEFYAFTKTLETYRKAVDGNTSLILTTDNELFDYLRSDRPPAGAARP